MFLKTDRSIDRSIENSLFEKVGKARNVLNGSAGSREDVKRNNLIMERDVGSLEVILRRCLFACAQIGK